MVEQPENRQVGPEVKKVVDDIAQNLIFLSQELNSALTPEMISVIGELFFGSQKKQITKPDGSIEEASWTIGDIFEEMDNNDKEVEKYFRRDMVKDLVLGLSAQHRFFTTMEHPARGESERNISLFFDLTERVVRSKEKVTDPYPFDSGQDYLAADVLEATRRVLLNPVTLIFSYRRSIGSIPDIDDEFWKKREELITSEMKEALERGDKEEYIRLEEERVRKGLKARTEDGWVKVVELESSFLRRFVLNAVEQAAYKKNEDVVTATQLSVASQKRFKNEIEGIKREASDLRKIADQFRGLEDLDSILSWIKQRFGENADLSTFLDYLNPQPIKQ